MGFSFSASFQKRGLFFTETFDFLLKFFTFPQERRIEEHSQEKIYGM